MAEPFFSLAGKVAIVTGGGQGIGEAICRRLAAAGAKVSIFDMAPEGANRVAAELKGYAGIGDVTNEADVFRVVAETEKALGPVDIIVNNAGITGRTVKLWELKKEEFSKVMDVNVIGPFLLCKAVMPGMLERKYGRIVSIASVAGKEGNPTMSPYSASKAAVIALTKSLAKEVAGQGDITVNAISPAVIQTPILDGVAATTVQYMVSKIPMGRTGKPEEVAALVHFLASGDSSFTTGQCYDISGGRSTY
ncbi:SDR family NAD(P)-dependent oxidoreductase [Zavarzinella formosa]|uniref:SDR family NAD(P)-dependent oxidoreductase n=1 Tax=Zavarzinella formosa TaxID=360055 RepID=UPI0002EE590E|nr:SDR family NAD(P)-dependent oxidoreductase [Zavarzinella formosa]